MSDAEDTEHKGPEPDSIEAETEQLEFYEECGFEKAVEAVRRTIELINDAEND